MATINDGELLLHVEGANEEELRLGLLAARASLDASGFTLDEGFEGVFQREGHDIDGTLEEMPRRLFDAAIALDIAAYEGPRQAVPAPIRQLRTGISLCGASFKNPSAALTKLGLGI